MGRSGDREEESTWLRKYSAGNRSPRPQGKPSLRRKELDPTSNNRGLGITPTSRVSMSRNRPRGAQNRDNGAAASEEVDMWNGNLRDLNKAKERNDKQKVLGQQISSLNEKIAKAGGSKLFSTLPFS